MRYSSLISRFSVLLIFIYFSLIGLPAKAIVLKPMRLMIPSIKVNTIIERVGLTKDGAVDTPKSLIRAGWFDLGPRPGEQGVAVIDGHYGFKKGVPAVFNNLSKLKKGDKIIVEDEKGKKITFIVSLLRSYDPEIDAETVFESIDDKSYLNLITCEGVWNAKTKQYSKRLVVFSDKE